MNKRIKFLISALLIFALFVSCFVFPASSFENEVETTTADMLLVNMDTDTVCFSQKPDNMWYAGSLSELMTFVVAAEMIEQPDETEYKVEQSFIDDLPYSDGCLDKYVGKTISAMDLMAIMLLTTGNDAAYALADIASDGDRDAFVEAMNKKAEEIGCKSTGYVSPGLDETSNQYTTCRDLYTLYKKVLEWDFYRKVMEKKTYTPKSLKDEEEDYSVSVSASILNENSPYYFRYANDAQFSYSEKIYANIAVTTTYRGKTYFFAGLLGLNESERNVYADARKMTTWAYLNLSDRKMINAEESLSQVKVLTGWGEYMVDLNPKYSAFKTLPNEYDESKLNYTFDIPESVKAPLLDGQTVGRAKITYDGNEIDDVELIVNNDVGLGILSDFGRFGSYVFTRLTPHEIPTEPPTEAPTKAPETEPVTEAPTIAPKETEKPAATVPSATISPNRR